jgi:hypothetical protein
MAEKRELSQLDFESLQMHKFGKPGKIALATTRPLTTQWDLSLAAHEAIRPQASQRGGTRRGSGEAAAAQ